MDDSAAPHPATVPPPDPPLRPVAVECPPPRRGELRACELLGTVVEPSTLLVVVGFPCDAGVRRNGGRPGAAEAPAAIRAAFHRLSPDPRDEGRMTSLLRRCVDLGDLEVEEDLDVSQARLARAIAPHLRAGRIVVVLGGGHETSFGTFLGHVEAGRSVAIVNLDAHPDVRPPLVEGDRRLGHSGSPFREAIEHPSRRCRGYAVAGLQPAAVSAAQLAWLREHGGEAVFIDEIESRGGDALSSLGLDDAPREQTAQIMASLDLDAVDASAAPGVSAPSVGGFSVSAWLEAAERLGRDGRVRSLDLVELAPPLDPDGRTARLAAHTLWRFLRGVSRRPG